MSCGSKCELVYARPVLQVRRCLLQSCLKPGERFDHGGRRACLVVHGMGSKRARQASVARPETNNLPAAPLLVCGFYVLVRSDRRNMRDTGEDSSELARASAVWPRARIGPSSRRLLVPLEPPPPPQQGEALLPSSQCCASLGELSASQLKLREMRCGLDNGRPGLPLLNEFIFHCSVGQ